MVVVIPSTQFLAQNFGSSTAPPKSSNQTRGLGVRAAATRRTRPGPSGYRMLVKRSNPSGTQVASAICFSSLFVVSLISSTIFLFLPFPLFCLRNCQTLECREGKNCRCALQKCVETRSHIIQPPTSQDRMKYNPPPLLRRKVRKASQDNKILP